MGSNDKSSARSTTAEPRPQQRRRVHGGSHVPSASRQPMAFDVGPAARPVTASTATATASVRTWRSTVVGVSLGLGLVLALCMKWLMGYQIDSAQERRVQQKAVSAATARCRSGSP